MKSLSLLFLSLVSVSSSHYLCRIAIAQESSAQVEQIARETTVQIAGQGSGVIIKRQGNTYWILTAAHVVADSRTLKILTADHSSHFASAAVQQIPNYDLALLKFDSDRSYRVIELGNSDAMTVGQPIFVSGFPAKARNLSATTYKLSKGEIIAHASRPIADGYAIAYFNNTFAGMSGGPILNANSQLVGIHGRAITQFSQTRGVNPMFNQKEGLNLGIPLNSFLKALPKVGLKLGFQLPSGESKSAEPIADDFFIEGMGKSAQGDYQGASDAFDRAMSLQPTYAVASYYRMKLRPFTLKSQGWKVVAVQVMADQKHFQAIAKLSKVSPYATLPPFLKFQSRGFDEKVKNPAANELERNVQEEPDDTALIYVRGLQRFGSGDYTGAVADFDSFLQLTTPESQLRRYVSEYKSYAMLELKDYRGVKIFLDQAMKEHPSLFKGDNTLLCYRAEARYALGDRKGAQADLETAQMSCRNAIVKTTDNTAYVKFIERGAPKEETDEEKDAKLIEEYRTKVVPLLEKCINKRKEIICKPKI